jgi:hypothetical protein
MIDFWAAGVKNILFISIEDGLAGEEWVRMEKAFRQNRQEKFSLWVMIYL